MGSLSALTLAVAFFCVLGPSDAIFGGLANALGGFFGGMFRPRIIYEDEAVKDVSEVTLVLMGMRHANRNPGAFLEGDPNEGQWGLEGDYQLNDAGKKEAFAHGQAMRQRYMGFLDQRFDSSECQAISSSADRCQHTMSLMLSGLYPPLGLPPTGLQPPSIAIDVPMLRMYKMNKCQPQIDGWAPIDNMELDSIKDKFADNEAEIDYIIEKSGFKRTLSALGDVSDNILNMIKLRLPLPDWVSNPTLEGYDGKSMLEKILSFGEGPQIECALYNDCRDMMGGTWLNHIINTLQAKEAGEKESLKLVAYTSHTEITLSVMRLMGYENHECPTSAGFIIEYKPGFVRPIFHEPEGDGSTRSIGLAHFRENSGLSPDANGWIALNDFVNAIKAGADEDWKSVCGITCDI